MQLSFWWQEAAANASAKRVSDDVDGDGNLRSCDKHVHAGPHLDGIVSDVLVSGVDTFYETNERTDSLAKDAQSERRGEWK